jgi:hypothetical protein
MAWTFGCVSVLIHVVCAFHYYHNWSHAAAYRETARQTLEVTGFDWGGGLFINYALVAGWIIDVVWWRRGLDAYRNRPAWLSATWHGFLIFIIFNATVVFKTGPLRWIGLGLCLWMAFLWLLAPGSKTLERSEDKLNGLFASGSESPRIGTGATADLLRLGEPDSSGAGDGRDAARPDTGIRVDHGAADQRPAD